METLVLEFGYNNLRILQIDESKKILLKEEISFPIEMKDDSIKLQESVKENFRNIFKNISYSKDIIPAGILVGTDQTFLSTIPIDFSEDQNIIDSHILWELSNYFPEEYKNYNIKYYRLNNNLNENIDEVLVLAISKSKIELREGRDGKKTYREFFQSAV